MPISVKQAGEWKAGKLVYAKVGGVWQQAKRIFTKIGGIWVGIWSAAYWTQKSNFQYARKQGQAVGVNGYLYYIGGRYNNDYSGSGTYTNERWDPNTNTWTYLANCLYKKTDGWVAARGQYIHIDSGTDDYYTHVMYDTVGNSWQTKNNIVYAQGPCAAHAGDGNTLYIAGGWNGGSYYSSFYKWQDSVGYSTGLMSMPLQRAWAAGGFIHNKFYVMGGEISLGQLTNQCHVFDPNTNAWTQVADLPEQVSQSPHWVLNSKMYVIQNSTSSKTFCYDPTTNAWIIGPICPSNVYYARGASLNGKGYVVGGIQQGTGNITQTLYELTM
ncbi:Kelch repeat-containing protein [Paenibacillus taiwanensis]|uniref:Kelch repeat-containing protein n=1 Tax=Paenibacillus taiwanensis TaxID=401638 RepID=UPI000427B1DF|nr:kelch repeat-containing protein [Paenibacillus taiwanensis]